MVARQPSLVHNRIAQPLRRRDPVNCCNGAVRWLAQVFWPPVALVTLTVLGGFTSTGAQTNTGWFALIVALMCLPFGGLLFALGIAKWLRNRSIARRSC